MARVFGPLHSIDASGTVGKALTFGSWKGKAYCRKYFIPENPRDPKQVNQRLALAIALAYYQSMSEPVKAEWEGYASGMGMSGANLFMKRCLNAYTVQLGTSKTPASVTVAGTYPAEVWTWVEAV